MRRMRGGAPPSASLAYTIRSTQKLFVDLSDILRVLDDTHTVTVAVTSSGAVLTANCWNDNTISNGQTTTQVLRDLWDNFWVETVAATDTSVAGTVTITGTLASNGQSKTWTLTFTVDNYPTLIKVRFGALTLPKFGGLALHDWLQGGGSGWSITVNPGSKWEILNVGSEYRLVLSGTLYGGAFNEAVPAAPLASAGGSTISVVLSHASHPSVTVDHYIVENQFDAAPWAGDTSTNQAMIFWGHYNPKAARIVCMLEDGTYSTGAVAICNAITNTAVFATTNQPATPYEGSSWAYSGYLKPSSGWMMMRSRSPLGATFTDGIALDARNVDRANECLGIRFSNIRTSQSVAGTGGKIYIYDGASANSPFNMVMIDHCDCYGLNFGRPTPVQSKIFGVQNRYRATNVLYGADCQDCGSLWLDNPMYQTGCDQYSPVTASFATTVMTVTDVSAQTTPLVVGSAVYPTGGTGVTISSFGTGSGGTGTYNMSGSNTLGAVTCKTFPTDLSSAAVDQMHFAVKNSTPGSGYCRIAFPTFIGGKVIAGLHCDSCQYDGPSVGSAAETLDSILGYGWVVAPGNSYVYTANDLQGVADPAWIAKQAPQGQMQFFHDVSSVIDAITFKLAGNILANSNLAGTLIDKPSSSTVIKNNMYLYPTSITDPSQGSASPQIKFQAPTATAGTGITVKDNLSSTSAIAYSGSWSPTVTDNGNVWNIDATWQTTNLTNPGIGASATSRSKSILAFTPLPGAVSDATTKGPFFNSSKIDLWRQTADETWIASA